MRAMLGLEDAGRRRAAQVRGKGRCHVGAMPTRAFPYVLHWCVLSAFTFLCGNVQITTRLVGAACPPLYWCMAQVLLLSSSDRDDSPRPGHTWLSGPRPRRWLLVYLGAYSIVGTALHSNFFPWT